MSPRRIVATALGTALAVTSLTRDAGALEIAAVTRHGYIVVDEPNAAAPYGGSAGAASVNAFAGFIGDVMTTLDAAGAPHGDFVAVMQQMYEPAVVAFYVRIRNQTRGVGDRNPQGGAGELYDLNQAFHTPWNIDGAVFLNTPGFYIGAFPDYGIRIICPQEFAHRFMAEIHVPPVPGAPMMDAGAGDAATGDASIDAEMDAGPQAVNVLLGRDLAHWSYFMNTGGSPMEGNAWTEPSPGVFLTGNGSLTFSPLELYLMGLAPAASVSPFWIIANPDVMGQRDNNGGPITRSSPPQAFGPSRPIEIRGTRVTYSIDDVILANGPRNPAYFDPDAGQSDDSGTVSVREMRTTWVLLTTTDMMDSRTVSQFDHAIEACQGGYATATHDLAHVVPVVQPQPDAGMEAGADAGHPEASTPSDATADASSGPTPFRAVGGCTCTTVPGHRERAPWSAVIALVAMTAVVSSRRRRAA
jgi:hypothetical protein